MLGLCDVIFIVGHLTDKSLKFVDQRTSDLIFRQLNNFDVNLVFFFYYGYLEQLSAIQLHHKLNGDTNTYIGMHQLVFHPVHPWNKI